MSRSLSYLRRGFLGIAFAGAMGFGVTQAFASTDQARRLSCPALGYDYEYTECAYSCPNHIGYCSAGGLCRCGQIP